jgi:hypothetical protein
MRQGRYSKIARGTVRKRNKKNKQGEIMRCFEPGRRGQDHFESRELPHTQASEPERDWQDQIRQATLHGHAGRGSKQHGEQQEAENVALPASADRELCLARWAARMRAHTADGAKPGPCRDRFGFAVGAASPCRCTQCRLFTMNSRRENAERQAFKQTLLFPNFSESCEKNAR